MCTELQSVSVTPDRIYHNYHDRKFYTTVKWEDGTKTTVCLDSPVFDQDLCCFLYDDGTMMDMVFEGLSRMGFLYALAKHVYGSTSKFIKNYQLAMPVMSPLLPKKKKPSEEEFKFIGNSKCKSTFKPAWKNEKPDYVLDNDMSLGEFNKMVTKKS